MPPLTSKFTNSTDARSLRPLQITLSRPLPVAPQRQNSTASPTPDARAVRSYRHHHHLPALAQFSTIDRKADSYPLFYILDSKGNVLDNVSLTTDKGAISSIKYQGEHGEYTVYETQGDSNGSNFFEFLADNTGVEYSIIQTGKNSNGTNYVTTSHKSNEEVGSYSLLHTLSDANRNVRTISHNHPGLTMPSGMTPETTHGDVQFARDINNLFKGQSIEYNVYMKDTKLYIPFNENSRATYCPSSEFKNIISHSIDGAILRYNANWLSKINLKR